MWVTKEADDYVIQIRQFILSLGLGAGQESNGRLSGISLMYRVTQWKTYKVRSDSGEVKPGPD